MVLMNEVCFIFDIHLPNPEVFCKVFKDNQSCIAIVEANKSLPKAKYIDIKYHHFLNILTKEAHLYMLYSYPRNKQRTFFHEAT